MVFNKIGNYKVPKFSPFSRQASGVARAPRLKSLTREFLPSSYGPNFLKLDFFTTLLYSLTDLYSLED